MLWLIKLRIGFTMLIAGNSAACPLINRLHYARLAAYLRNILCTPNTHRNTPKLGVAKKKPHTFLSVGQQPNLIMNNVPHIHTIKSQKGQHKIITSSQT